MDDAEAARLWDAKLTAAFRAARPGEVFGPITPPPGAGPDRPWSPLLAEAATQIVKRTGPEPSFADLVEHRPPPPAAPTYTREEAIGHLVGLSFTVDQQMCVGKRESDALEAETNAALRALGVTEDELAGG